MVGQGLRSVAAATLLGILAVTAARAGEAPTAEERTRVEEALRGLGFASWEDIERADDGTAWEVDDARLPDGGEFNLKLAVDDLREIAREPD